MSFAMEILGGIVSVEKQVVRIQQIEHVLIKKSSVSAWYIYVVIGGDVKLANFNCITGFHARFRIYVSGSGVASTDKLCVV